MANYAREKTFKILANREMQIKATTIRIAKIEIDDNTKCWQGCRQTGSLIYCPWEYKMV